MKEAQRLAYLQAIGIQVWKPLNNPPVVDEAMSQLAADENPATLSAAEASDEPGLPETLLTEAFVDATACQEAPLDALPESLEILEQQVSSCERCALHQTRTQTVFASGSREADWMVIGEAPGASEDEQGKPFVGRAGQLLTEMLRAIRLDREAVYIANILKCRPPDNRDPQADEVAQCEPYLAQQVKLVKPKMILAVGRVAAQNLLKTDRPIGKLRGEVHHYQGIPVVVIYHPAYLLRSPLEKKKAWGDLRFARRVFSEQISTV